MTEANVSGTASSTGATPRTGNPDPAQIDEFLGAKPRPWWRRWMKVWLPVLVLVILALSVSQCMGGDEQPEYITDDVVARSLDLTVSATGNLRPTNQVDIGSEVSGRVDRVLVDVNDRVARGQVLAQINTDVIGDQVTQGRANVNAARAQLNQAGATLDVERAQLARLRNVYEASGGKVPSQTELEQAEAAVKRSAAAVASARANITSAEAQLSSSVTSRNRAVIRSPVSGVVLARQVEPGQTVVASFNTPNLFIIAEDLAAMQLRVEIDEADVGQVEEGQKATFTVDAYPGRRFPAVVERVDQASSNTGSQTGQATPGANSVVSYEARLAVTNSEGLLRPGMTATATIATQSTGKKMLVPNGALRFDPDEEVDTGGGSALNVEVGLEQQEQQASIGVGSKQRVHVLKDDGTLEAIDVITGQTDGRMTVVTSSALEPGMKVVTGVGAKTE
ncbi:Macrolide export protein MacA [Alteripontixanthobacter maritimus]|uniref:Macrolide export protein MacA n=1 Tax=Alteripontixanthobacter maritimus TaxID=2161824 RepID=A0A369QDJ7_9SPHN|nr:efflux RND transporter periplasmic adaptor subunit [Alteripontixanthobacter maritimus]RDC61296.1 Macrolide export protein MacA [Alteripontixanthobacter maritimus]